MSEQPSADSRQQAIVARFLRLLYVYKCICDEITCERCRELKCERCMELTCEPCIARYIVDGQYEEADAALSRWDQVGADQSPQSEIHNPQSSEAS